MCRVWYYVRFHASTEGLGRYPANKGVTVLLTCSLGDLYVRWCFRSAALEAVPLGISEGVFF